MGKAVLLFAAVGACALVAGCSSSSSHHVGAGTSHGSSARTTHLAGGASGPSATAAAGGRASAGGSGDHDSEFCRAVRAAGKDELALSAPVADENVSKALATVDHLRAMAPAAIKDDFAVFAAFEHAVLAPGSATPPTGDSAPALEHVAQYFATVCGVDAAS